jgi:hypothetical protein
MQFRGEESASGAISILLYYRVLYPGLGREKSGDHRDAGTRGYHGFCFAAGA